VISKGTGAENMSLGRSDGVHSYSPDGSKEWPRGRKKLALRCIIRSSIHKNCDFTGGAKGAS
jgi:hypothetical protein